MVSAYGEPAAVRSLEASHQFGGEMLGVGGRGAIAGEQIVAALLDAGFDVLDRRTQGVRTTVAANLNEPADFRVPGTAMVTEQGSGDDSVTNGARSPRR